MSVNIAGHGHWCTPIGAWCRLPCGSMVGTRKVQHIVLLSPSVDLMSMVMLLSSGPPVVSQHHRRGSVLVLSRSTESDVVCQVLVSISTLWCVSAIRTVSDDTVCSYLFQWCVSAFLVCVLLLWCVSAIRTVSDDTVCRIYFNGVLVPSLCVLLLWCVSAIRTVSDDTVCSYLFQWCVSAFLCVCFYYGVLVLPRTVSDDTVCLSLSLYLSVLVPSLCVLLLWCVSAIRTVSDDTVCSYLFQWCVSAFLVCASTMVC